MNKLITLLALVLICRSQALNGTYEITNTECPPVKPVDPPVEPVEMVCSSMCEYAKVDGDNKTLTITSNTATYDCTKPNEFSVNCTATECTVDDTAKPLKFTCKVGGMQGFTECAVGADAGTLMCKAGDCILTMTVKTGTILGVSPSSGGGSGGSGGFFS